MTDPDQVWRDTGGVMFKFLITNIQLVRCYDQYLLAENQKCCDEYDLDNLLLII